MGELFGMWRNTRMVVLTSICAALYAAILIPFKVVPLIPGITEFRPANAVPVVCSFLFGPAAAWGAAFGNLIGDFFGGLGPGDLFGFVGNFCYGLIPYLVWDAVTSASPISTGAGWTSRVGGGSLRLLLPTTLGAMACATVVGWGLHSVGFHPFNVLGTLVFLNNMVVAVVLSPLLLSVLYPRVARARLLYRDVLGPRRRLPRWRAALGVSLVVIGVVGGFAAGQTAATGRWQPPWVEPSASARAQVGYGVPPLLAVMAAGLALL